MVSGAVYAVNLFSYHMRSSRVVRASDSQCRSRNCSGFNPSIFRHSGAADKTVLNIVHKKRKNPPLTFFLTVQDIVLSGAQDEFYAVNLLFNCLGHRPVRGSG
jgi:hypothetical protein